MSTATSPGGRETGGGPPREARGPTPVPRVTAPPVSTFRRDYARRSRPVVLTDVADAWPARARWSLDYLAATHGSARVTVARVDGGAVVADPTKGLLFEASTLARFVASAQAGAPIGYLMSRLDELPAELQREAPIPGYCEGASWRVSKLWISAAGTTSALHFDLADNVHTVITGAKRFLLYAPEERDLVYPRGLFSSIPNGAHVDPEAPDLARFPRLARAHPLVAELRAGDTLFIPHGWWHHARSLESSITVNSWWAEGARLAIVWAAEGFKRIRGISR